MSRRTEDSASSWMKVIIPAMLAVCMTLGGALWQQSSTLTAVKTTSDERVLVIDGFKKEDKELRQEIRELSSEVASIKSEVRTSMNTQDKVLDVVDRLSSTLGRLEVAMGKLETKLEYRIQEG